MEESREIRHFHMFCGSGGGGKGFNSAQPRVGNMTGKFRCLGGIDVDPGAIHDFKLLTGVDGTLIDVFDREQYIDFHGHEPLSDWKEITVADLHRAAGNERPHIVFLSPPCKGFSGLLAESKSRTDKYRALNRLTVRGVWLMLEAWRDDPPDAAKAIAEVMGTTLLLAWSGETFVLSSTPIWVQPVAIAMSVDVAVYLQ